jgi:hypothetical protein
MSGRHGPNLEGPDVVFSDIHTDCWDFIRSQKEAVCKGPTMILVQDVQNGQISILDVPHMLEQC